MVILFVLRNGRKKLSFFSNDRTLNAKKEVESWGPDQTKNHHPALINILAETMHVDGKRRKMC